ncbi:Hypothetical predicted protein [Mytilus galloprovincialis]|uniref:C1q domain-containing protein n=1 Tax=Mytilus galloprovincialis TaxID=29158 RepID=A0A8B6E0P3_MYTGA|nr:Hypothetical predicted protein [Mytilus galloprovincialis]
MSGDRNFHINSIVKFDTEFVDEENNFNTGDGIFVAPVSGVYLFSWAIQTHYSQNEETELQVDNIVIIGKQLMSMGSGASYFGTTRNVLCTVSKGNHVWIQTSNIYGDNYFNDLRGIRSSFMGPFIQEL